MNIIIIIIKSMHISISDHQQWPHSHLKSLALDGRLSSSSTKIGCRPYLWWIIFCDKIIIISMLQHHRHIIIWWRDSLWIAGILPSHWLPSKAKYISADSTNTFCRRAQIHSVKQENIFTWQQTTSLAILRFTTQ